MTTKQKRAKEQFVVCVGNDAYPASLERRKIYRAVPDPEARRHGQLRIIDESGEDYLYPATLFVPIELSAPLRRAVEEAA
jgi:hypothetical protein